jgi:hypothetical protein
MEVTAVMEAMEATHPMVQMVLASLKSETVIG